MMDNELQALCEAAHRCNTWAREFVEAYSRCNDAPRETDGFGADYWSCGNRARTQIRNAQRRLDKLRKIIRDFSSTEYDDAWSCIEQAVSADPPQQYVVGDETHVIAHEAAFKQARHVVTTADACGMSAIVDELTLKDCFETIRTAAEQFSGIRIDDLRALIRRESVNAIRGAEDLVPEPDDTRVRDVPTQTPLGLPDNESKVSPADVPTVFREGRTAVGKTESEESLIGKTDRSDEKVVVRADNDEVAQIDWPDDPDLRDFLIELESEGAKPKEERRSINAIAAAKFAGSKKRKPESVIRVLRRKHKKAYERANAWRNEATEQQEVDMSRTSVVRADNARQ